MEQRSRAIWKISPVLVCETDTFKDYDVAIKKLKLHLRLFSQVDAASGHDVKSSPNLCSEFETLARLSRKKNLDGSVSYDQQKDGLANLTLATVNKVSSRNKTSPPLRSHLNFISFLFENISGIFDVILF